MKGASELAVTNAMKEVSPKLGESHNSEINYGFLAKMVVNQTKS